MATTLIAPTTTAPHLQGLDNVEVQSIYLTLTGQDTIADFNYYKDPGDGSPPPASYVGKPETFRTPTVKRPMTVHDIRGSEDKYSLDGSGFEIYTHVSQEKTFDDEEMIKKSYYLEVEDIVKSATGASKVFCFDHAVRRPSPDQQDGTASKRGPVQHVHIDQNYKTPADLVKQHLPTEAERLLRGRYQIINVWRPIKTIRKDPLGVIDAMSVSEEDLVTKQLFHPDGIWESFTVCPNENHQWYYLKEQNPEEVMLFKCFDSKVDGRARRVPHSAFVDQGTENEVPRESIEVRALVFHPDDVEQSWF